MSESVGYVGKDLEAMSFAVNYHRWILSGFAPYLGTRVVEVGAGKGSFSELLCECRPQSLSLIEPSPSMFMQLSQTVKEFSGPVEVKLYNETFASVAAQIRMLQQPDSIVYVNVLEHTADDEAEMRVMHDTLGSGGRVFIFVPALSWLYGSFDRELNHYRRYSRGDLEEKCRAAGFRILVSRYFDLFGVVPWWIKYKLLQSRKMESATVKFYDQAVVPIAKRIEAKLDPPVGKNILLVAEKI
ncbi:MAG TPA: methyltransferase domain-containing protein [Pyrinomonadaceae bacterium]|nr:methyltransferase domain-containing protein [Pyrinomonadaceae bacterium]